MARIRTIKPEFWTDEKIVQLPYEARLLFIGLWNFCDDEGYLRDEPDRIQLQVLPADDVDCGELIDLLIAIEVLQRVYLTDGCSALFIPSFPEHQKISHAAESRIAPLVYKKEAIPQGIRRQLAEKYGCGPCQEVACQCFYCGAPGRVIRPAARRGGPSKWACFVGMEIEHVEPEFNGGECTAQNLVLACRYCNRSKKTDSAGSMFLRKLPEDTGTLRPELNRNGIELNTSIDREDRPTVVAEYPETEVDRELWDSLLPDFGRVASSLNGDRTTGKRDRETTIRCVLVARRRLGGDVLDRVLDAMRDGVRREEIKKPFAYFQKSIARECTDAGLDFHRAARSFAIPHELLNPKAKPP